MLQLQVHLVSRTTHSLMQTALIWELRNKTVGMLDSKVLSKMIQVVQGFYKYLKNAQMVRTNHSFTLRKSKIVLQAFKHLASVTHNKLRLIIEFLLFHFSEHPLSINQYQNHNHFNLTDPKQLLKVLSKNQFLNLVI